MELKYIKPSAVAFNYFPFNRTAYGIEMQLAEWEWYQDSQTFNRTAYGIEIFLKLLIVTLCVFLLIAPLMELK